MGNIANTLSLAAEAAGQTDPAADPWEGGADGPCIKNKINKELQKGNILVIVGYTDCSSIDPPYEKIVAVLSVFQEPEVVWREVVEQRRCQSIYTRFTWLELQSYNPEFYDLDGMLPEKILATIRQST